MSCSLQIPVFNLILSVTNIQCVVTNIHSHDGFLELWGCLGIAEAPGLLKDIIQDA